jgi:hypothetical protein
MRSPSSYLLPNYALDPVVAQSLRIEGDRNLQGFNQMSDEWKPTGLWDAFLISVLARSGMEPDAVAAMTAQERIDAARMAAEAGRFDTPTMEAMKRLGILEDITSVD